MHVSGVGIGRGAPLNLYKILSISCPLVENQRVEQCMCVHVYVKPCVVRVNVCVRACMPACYHMPIRSATLFLCMLVNSCACELGACCSIACAYVRVRMCVCVAVHVPLCVYHVSYTHCMFCCAHEDVCVPVVLG